jgi:hypothetical protein
VFGLSRPRRKPQLRRPRARRAALRQDAVARCGRLVVDIDIGNAVEWLRFEHTIEEFYDVAVMSGVRQAEAVGLRADDIQREIIPG